MINKWPKKIPEISHEQKVIMDDFMKHWHTVLPRKYGIIENFNHGYPLKSIIKNYDCRTLEIGAGLGEHLEYESVDNQEYVAMELREKMAQEIKKRFPKVKTIVGDCQKKIPEEANSFDRVLAIHVLEHLPDLPSALKEIHRVLKKDGVFIAVIPCEGGLAYSLARNISARRIFEKRYNQSYDWLINIEHINRPAEIIQEIQEFFNIAHSSYFPLYIPSKELNLCIGLTMRKKGS